MFGYFTGLVDSYSKCLAPRREELVRLQTYVEDPSQTLEIAVDRYEFLKSKLQEERKTKEQKAKEEEMEAMQIDWHDFVTVEVITFDDEPEEKRPPPISSVRQKVEEVPMDVDMDTEESKTLDAINRRMEEQTQPKHEEFKEPPKREVVPEDNEEDMDLDGARIVTDYERRPEVVDGRQKCPKCGKMIPSAEFERHLKIELSSPSYHAQRKDLINKTEGRSIATSDEIVSNLKEFVSQRPDISGNVEKQLPSAVKEERQRKPQVVYDGSLGNMSRTTANVAMMAVQQKKNAGLARDPSAMAAELAAAPARKVMNLLTQQPVAGMQPVAPPKPAPPAVAAAPVLNPLAFLRTGMSTTLNMTGGLLPIDKYGGSSDDTLMPEEEWLRHFPGSLTIHVRVPNDGGESEWNFVGQILKLSMDPRTTVGKLKGAISSYLGNMPPKKMRLRTFNRSVMKDEFSLAHYNILNGTTLELNVKERGRRRK
eukprot:TRINITY_DN897_c0_g1_i5.p1 TRINITY_DN897_c0_g1~~TRINITY_DN897_c0_g1_i5.p1  ORF type:complete len:481 (-),score=187.70 TRINITY_DN897_c0_g1_i5:187-1629(-)